ncbi:serine hydrolase [Agrilactobacillus yilanensis]|uniref:Serine hydrolase n=1 Tax=Agrilactobacillus yilanensis TaxID=2485997 RepID=A0ABW4J573_9LACO
MRKHHRLKKIIKHGLILTLTILFVLSSSFAYATQAQTVQAANSTTKTNAATKKALLAKWQKILNQTDSAVQIVVYDKSSNQTYTLTNNKQGTFTTASTVKVAILAGLLHMHEQNGTTLSSNEKALAEKMIKNSDNDAATTLFNEIGGFDGLNAVFEALGMTDTSSSNGWGLTVTTATDQLKLLNNVFYSSSYISSTSRNYIKTLMGDVSRDQNWGISAGSTTYQLKNGWRTDSDSRWIVDSIGHVGANNKGYTIAVYTYGNTTLASGETLIEQLAKATAETLGSN